jgi:PAS domain S-box-containing protein
VTTLLALRLARGSLHTARIERLVEDRTMKLSEANSSLRETGDRLRALVEASPLATISLDLDGKVTSWSQAAEHLFGWTAREVVGTQPPNVPEDRRTELEAYRRRSLEGNEVLQAESQRLRRDGSVVDVMTYIAPLHDELGRPSGSMTVIADITERKQVEEALRESEERFRTAFDEAAVGMAITGLDGNFRRVNRALCDIVGYSAEELLQMRFHDVTHHDDREDNVAALQAFVEGGARVLRLEKRYVHRNGDEVWVLLNIALVRDAGGTPLYFVTEIQDITDWKRAVQALRESEERFRLMADSAPALAWMSEADGQPSFYNRGWLDFTGRTLEEELAQPNRAIHPDDIAAATASFADAISARTSWEAEYRLRRHDGVYRWISDWAVPRFLPDGSYAGLTGVAVDITERKQAEEERERLLAYEREQVERLRELDVLKDDLVATVSHELRTPLTNILGYVNVAVGVISDGEGRRLLSVIERNAKRLLNLVNDLLVVAQVDSGKLTIQNERIDLPALVREAVESARAAAQLKGLTLRLEAKPVDGFRGDQSRLVQLVDNLVGNAIKFTASGGEVTVRVGTHAGTAFLEVEDSGIGIAEKDLNRLFERFYRAAEARQEAVQGTGLGLTIVRAIAEAHGGSVTVRSAPGEGATFRVELPLQASRRAAA